MLKTTARLELLLPVALLLGLPLLGVWLAGDPVAQYMEFPPTTRYVEHAPFSWPAFLTLTAALAAILLPFERRVFRCRRGAARAEAVRPFPWWGWVGVLAGALAWVAAWSRLAWMAPLQRFTFSPQWLAYIVVVNGLTYRLKGRCMLTHERPRLLCLFTASAAFWWFFEYLNRFVQNWYYEGAGGLTPWQYFWFATLPFATVLPAVLGTAELLEAVPRAGAGLDRWAALPVRAPKVVAWAALGAAAAGLAGIGVWPSLLFPLLWISPLVIIVALQAISGRRTMLAPLARGNWRHIYLLAAAALICGCFWEMWNFYSLAKWKYAVPYVDRFHIFEMPILGFAGYLPFGLECAVVAEWLRGSRGRSPSKATTNL